MEKQERSSFSSRVGFVLAAAGSAVGLGNLWRFPYLAARYGGGIFLLVYLILVVTFGFSLMITEFAIGRKTKLSCIGAYGALDKRFSFLGWIAAFVPLIITPYYCVIGGWVMKYLWTFISGGALEAADNGKVVVDEGFDRAWRRVGLALDRVGFTVEDRDRVQGIYFVRYVDPDAVKKEGFFSKLFGNEDKNKEAQRYRVLVSTVPNATTTDVTVQTNDGKAETGATGAKILQLLADELK